MPTHVLSDQSQSRGDADARLSRREFLKNSAALAVAGPAILSGRQSAADETRLIEPAQGALKSRLLYVGTYSVQSGSPGAGGHGKGIYLVEMDRPTGALTARRVFANDSNPSWIALDPSETHLYCVDEVSQFRGKPTGAVRSYSIDRSTGFLTALNTVSSEGSGPAHLSVHPSGRYVLVANYAGGSLAVLPILASGELGSATDVHRDSGRVGPTRATDAPPGSFAIGGHHKPHAHMIHADPSGKRVLSTDLGLDQIFVWNFDLAKGKLVPNNPHSVSAPAGDGPRHFVFHPNARWLYCIMEEASAVVVFDYDDSTGRLTRK
jgi:6-phosphogluconolactonase